LVEAAIPQNRSLEEDGYGAERGNGRVREWFSGGGIGLAGRRALSHRRKLRSEKSSSISREGGVLWTDKDRGEEGKVNLPDPAKEHGVELA